MKIVVIGGSGLIGSKLVAQLEEQGHEAIAASPSSGVDAVSGTGLSDVLDGADVVVDVSNSPSFEDAAVLEFFTTSTAHLLAAEIAAGVGHHVALSVVGTERLSDSGYMRAKVAQEQLILASSVPYTIVHATQFFEFFTAIADGATSGGEVRLAPAPVQPIAADDVAAAVARVATAAPIHGTIEIAGPDTFPLSTFISRGLASRGDERTVVPDPSARYFGALLRDRELLPGDDALILPTPFSAWLSARPGPVTD